MCALLFLLFYILTGSIKPTVSYLSSWRDTEVLFSGRFCFYCRFNEGWPKQARSLHVCLQCVTVVAKWLYNCRDCVYKLPPWQSQPWADGFHKSLTFTPQQLVSPSHFSSWVHVMKGQIGLSHFSWQSKLEMNSYWMNFDTYVPRSTARGLLTMRLTVMMFIKQQMEQVFFFP